MAALYRSMSSGLATLGTRIAAGPASLNAARSSAPQRVSSALARTTSSRWPKPPSRTAARSEEHTSELQPLMRNSYAVFCLKKQTKAHTENSPQLQSKQKKQNQQNLIPDKPTSQ